MCEVKIIVCGNSETLGCDHDDSIVYADKIVAMERDGIEIEINSQFRHWNGGPGYATGGAYVQLTGYGRVKDFDEARKALGFMLSGGGSTPETSVRPPDEWPAAGQIEAAFELLEEVQKVEVPESAE